ncbi:hypothetical protein L1887_25664 [Cichorium endivia]|nr:hypothetical protein L1887_25664 [Cichorium endivia]
MTCVCRLVLRHHPSPSHQCFLVLTSELPVRRLRIPIIVHRGAIVRVCYIGASNFSNKVATDSQYFRFLVSSHPTGGTIVPFDRKMLINFRKNCHN